MNGYAEGSRRPRRHGGSDSEREPSPESSQDEDKDEEEEEEESTGRRPLARKTAVAAVSKMKMMGNTEEDEGTPSEDEGSQKAGGRQVTRAGRRAAVIQSSSESEERPSSRSTQKGQHRSLIMTVCVTGWRSFLRGPSPQCISVD